MRPQGLLVVISGPSGVGKGTICAELINRHDDYVFSVSATTRAPRPGEIDGVHYSFKTPEQFNEMIARGAFLEHATVHGCQYGTPRDFVLEKLAQQTCVLLDIDVQGGLSAMRAYPDAVSIFVAPPSHDELRARLMNRKSETREQMELRLQNAEREMQALQQYTYCVVNDKLYEAIATIEAILLAERCRVSRGAGSAI